MIGGVIVEEIIMDKLITPPKQATSLTWGPPPDPCKQAVSGRSRGEVQGACPPPPVFRQNQICQGKKNKCFYTTLFLSQSLDELSPPPHPSQSSEWSKTNRHIKEWHSCKGGLFPPHPPLTLAPLFGWPLWLNSHNIPQIESLLEGYCISLPQDLGHPPLWYLGTNV